MPTDPIPPGPPDPPRVPGLFLSDTPTPETGEQNAVTTIADHLATARQEAQAIQVVTKAASREVSGEDLDGFASLALLANKIEQAVDNAAKLAERSPASLSGEQSHEGLRLHVVRKRRDSSGEPGPWAVSNDSARSLNQRDWEVIEVLPASEHDGLSLGLLMKLVAERSSLETEREVSRIAREGQTNLSHELASEREKLKRAFVEIRNAAKWLSHYARDEDVKRDAPVWVTGALSDQAQRLYDVISADAPSLNAGESEQASESDEPAENWTCRRCGAIDNLGAACASCGLGRGLSDKLPVQVDDDRPESSDEEIEVAGTDANGHGYRFSPEGLVRLIVPGERLVAVGDGKVIATAVVSDRMRGDVIGMWASPSGVPDGDGRTYTIHVCSLCGSDDIEESDEDNAKCGKCGEWMNTVALTVVAEARIEDLKIRLGLCECDRDDAARDRDRYARDIPDRGRLADALADAEKWRNELDVVLETNRKQWRSMQRLERQRDEALAEVKKQNGWAHQMRRERDAAMKQVERLKSVQPLPPGPSAGDGERDVPVRLYLFDGQTRERWAFRIADLEGYGETPDEAIRKGLAHFGGDQIAWLRERAAYRVDASSTPAGPSLTYEQGWELLEETREALTWMAARSNWRRVRDRLEGACDALEAWLPKGTEPKDPEPRPSVSDDDLNQPSDAGLREAAEHAAYALLGLLPLEGSNGNYELSKGPIQGTVRATPEEWATAAHEVAGLFRALKQTPVASPASDANAEAGSVADAGLLGVLRDPSEDLREIVKEYLLAVADRHPQGLKINPDMTPDQAADNLLGKIADGIEVELPEVEGKGAAVKATTHTVKLAENPTRVLGLVVEEGPLTPGEYADRADLTLPRTNRALSLLGDIGAARRKANGTWGATPEGEALWATGEEKD